MLQTTRWCATCQPVPWIYSVFLFLVLPGGDGHHPWVSDATTFLSLFVGGQRSKMEAKLSHSKGRDGRVETQTLWWTLSPDAAAFAPLAESGQSQARSALYVLSSCTSLIASLLGAIYVLSFICSGLAFYDGRNVRPFYNVLLYFCSSFLMIWFQWWIINKCLMKDVILEETKSMYPLLWNQKRLSQHDFPFHLVMSEIEINIPKKLNRNSIGLYMCQ